MTKRVNYADLAVSDLATNGGKLQPEENDRFFRKLIDSPTILGQIRSVQMDADTMKINKIGLGSRILRAAPSGTPPYAADDGTNDRYLAAADRFNPVTSQVTLAVKEVIAETHITDDVMENNIEGDNFRNTLLDLVADRVSTDLEELIISGDTASGDAYLALQDGILKRITSNVVDAGGSPLTPELFNALMKSLPTRYRRDLAKMKFYGSMDQQMDYRLAQANRSTALGDAMLQGSNAIPVFGVPYTPVALMPNSQIVFTDPKNIIFGLQRSLRIEADRDIRARSTIFVITAKVGITIEEETAASKLYGIG